MTQVQYIRLALFHLQNKKYNDKAISLDEKKLYKISPKRFFFIMIPDTPKSIPLVFSKIKAMSSNEDEINNKNGRDLKSFCGIFKNTFICGENDISVCFVNS